MMQRILSGLGCFALVLLAILFALGVTEAIKYVSALERALVLTAAVLAAFLVAFVRDWIKNGAADAPQKSEIKNEPTQQQRVPAEISQPSTSSSASSIPDAIMASRRQAIIFRQIVPPNHDSTHLSFFGGLPIAPSGFQWPRGESKPYTFFMQVDCSAVPENGRLGIFPDNGVLYLFLDLEWEQKSLFRVTWEPGPIQGWAEIAPPDDLPHAYKHRVTWSWPQSDADWPRVLPKWPFDPVLIQGGPLPDDPEALEETYCWPGTIHPKEAITAIEGAVAKHRSFWYEGGKPKRERPFAGFPHDWNAIRITTGLMAERIKYERLTSLARKHQFRDLSDQEFEEKMMAVQDELRDWSDRASAVAAFDEVPAAERDQFWSWVEEHDWITRHPMIDAGNLSVEASLSNSPESAARIPIDVVDFIRSRHGLATELENKVHVNIPDRMLAAPTDVQGTIDEYVREFLLLFEFSADEGIAHYFAEGVLYFWIRPDDLAERRFDRVEFSSTAY